MRLDRGFSEVYTHLETHWPEVAHTFALAERLIGTDRSAITDWDFARAYDELGAFAQAGSTWPRFTGHPQALLEAKSIDAEVQRAEVELAFLDKLWSSVELALCVVRTGLCQALAANPQWRTGPHRDALAAMVAAHTRHRLADREAAVRALRRSISARFSTLNAPLEARIAALEAASVEALLVDRGLTRV
jgi:hypothetical protein